MSTLHLQVRVFLLLWILTVFAESACDVNWEYKDGSCLRVINSDMTWENGNTRCNNLHSGAHLIYLKGSRTMSFLKGLKDFQNNEYHVGAEKTAGVFLWGDGSSISINIELSSDNSGSIYTFIKGWESTLKLFPTDLNHNSKIICEYSLAVQGSSSPSLSSSLSSSSSVLQPLSSSSSSLHPSSSPSSSAAVASSSSLTSASSTPSSSSSSLHPSSSPSSSAATAIVASSSSLLPSASSTVSSSQSAQSSVLLSSSSLQPSPSLQPVQPTSSPSCSSSFQPLPSLQAPSPSSSLHHVIPSPSPTQHGLTSTVTSPSNKDTLQGQDLVSTFMSDLSKLNITDPSSLEASINLTQLFLEGMEKITASNKNPLLVSERLEDFSLRFAEHHLNNTEIMRTTKNIVVMVSNTRNVTQDFVFVIPETRTNKHPTKVIIPKEDMDKQDTSIVVLYYNNLNVLMQRYQQNIRKKIQSNILVVAMNPSKQSLDKNVTLRFSVNQSKNDSSECSFWNFTSREPGWSRDGCTVAMATSHYVECSCNHLTHFAVLVQIDDDKLPDGHNVVLTILTYIGLTLSILGCILTFCIYWALTDVKSEQTQIRMNLVAFLAVAHTLFLLNSLAQKYLFSCVAVAVLTQFSYTSALCWMCAEGLLLYQHIVKVFNSDLNMKYVYCFALGIPTLLVVCSLSIAGNHSTGLSSLVNDNFCWLSVKNHLIWVFIVPVFLLILINLVILGMVLKEIIRINRPNCGSALATVKTNVKAFALLAPLLGITWLTGLLCILGAGLVGVYVFTILNSTQGLFIFIFYCIRSSEIRMKLQRKIKVMDESTPVGKVSSGPGPVKLLHVQYKPHPSGQQSTPCQDNLVLSDFDKTGFKETATRVTRLSKTDEL